MIIQNTAENVDIEHVTANNSPLVITESINNVGPFENNLSKNTNIQTLKAALSFRAVVESDGQVLQHSGKLWRIRCPFHGERTPSFYIDETDDAARCYGCGWYGDVFKYVMERTGCSFGAAFHHLKQSPTLHGTKTKRIPKQSREPEAEYSFTSTELSEIDRSTSRILHDRQKCQAIAAARSWKPETIRELATKQHLGWGGDALNFIYKTGIKVRQWPGKEFYWWAGQPYLWRADQLKNASSVYLTEGEPDAITLLDTGLEHHGNVAVVAAPSASTFSKKWAELFRGKEVTICFDADEAGRRGANQVASLLKPVASQLFNLDLKEVA